MKKTDEIHIFIPEWVPLSNKGEGAIVLGMADVLFPGQKVVPCVFDMQADHIYEQDGVKAYPGKWFYADWRTREFGLALSWERIYSSACSLLRNGLNRLFPNWIMSPQFPLRRVERTLQRYQAGFSARNEYERGLYELFACDYIIAGHNGGLDEYVCHTLNLLHRYGYRFGVFGSSLKPKVNSGPIIEIFKQTLKKADYIYVRNQIALNWSQKHMPECNVILAPDPAFGMKSASKAELEAVLKENNLEGFVKERRLIVLTVCEPAPIARYSFLDYKSPEQKRQIHRSLLAGLVDHILDTTDVNLLFLPHSIGPEEVLDDRIVADKVLQLVSGDKTRIRVMRADISGRVLKELIGSADLLIAERIHSIIGSVMVGTPFISIGSNADSRIHGIVEQMLQASSRVFLLDRPEKNELYRLFDFVWNNLEQVRGEQQATNHKVLAWLEKAGLEIRQKIDMTSENAR